MLLNYPEVNVTAGAVTGTLAIAVGSTNTYLAGAAPAHVIVTGTFNDGSQQVLLDTDL